MTRWLRVGAFAAVAAAGCSGNGPYPVSGRVVYEDGKPAAELARWNIVFDNPDMRVSSVGVIDSEGKYKLDYRKRGDGAVPGTYKVTIISPDVSATDESAPKAGAPERKSKRPLSAKYADVGETPLTATVEAKPNDITLTVSRP